MHTASYDWLLTARTDQDFKSINEILNATAVRFDQNIVAAYSFTKHRFEDRSFGLCDTNFKYKKNKGRIDYDHNNRRYAYKNRRDYNDNCRYGSQNRSCSKTEYERNYYRATERFRNLSRSKMYKKSGTVLPLWQSGILTSQSRKFEMTNISRFSLKLQYKKINKLYHYSEVFEGIYLLQYFKVRINSTLYAYFLGKRNYVKFYTYESPVFLNVLWNLQRYCFHRNTVCGINVMLHFEERPIIISSYLRVEVLSVIGKQ